MSKVKGKIVNLQNYNKALVNRGSVTFWIDEETPQLYVPTSKDEDSRLTLQLVVAF